MQRDDTIRTLHILEAARKALHFVENRTRDDLDKDEMLAISLVHLLEIVGEAANCVSADFREQHPHIPWKKNGKKVTSSFVNCELQNRSMLFCVIYSDCDIRFGSR